MKKILFTVLVLCMIGVGGVCFYPYPALMNLVGDVSLFKDHMVLVRYYGSQGGADVIVGENHFLHSAASNGIVAMSSSQAFLGEGDKEFYREQGLLYIVPRCLSCLPFDVITSARRGIYFEYCPFNEVLYLSEDCARLGYDYTMGFCISNVPPRVVGIDMDQLKRNIQNPGDTTDAWKYKGYYRYDK